MLTQRESNLMIHVREASVDDARHLAPRLRPADLQEIKANSGREPLAVLLDGLDRSTPAYAIVHDEEPIAVFGVCPLPPLPLGLVWMLAAPALENARIPFLRQCRGWIDRLHQGFPTLVSLVDERNITHIEWLKWCGFQFVHLHPAFGVEKRPFYEVYRTARHV